ncbi:hypothetical protein PG997_010740 [Apiospora hydei]|uniref:Uncharacterized protein n=1 Tax=Apiospora hydei TaxID=1337664 RepID=A0ABR1VI26_9PEZI
MKGSTYENSRIDVFGIPRGDAASLKPTFGKRIARRWHQAAQDAAAGPVGGYAEHIPSQGSRRSPSSQHGSCNRRFDDQPGNNLEQAARPLVSGILNEVEHS